MNSIEQLIRQRRSIRRYTSRPIPEETLGRMLACAATAPSPSNSQPVRWVRIDSSARMPDLKQALEDGYRKLRERLQDLTDGKRLRNRINAYYRYAAFLFDAPVLLAVGVTNDHTGFSRLLVDSGLRAADKRGDTDLDISVGLAVNTFILSAEAFGVGTCILTAPLVFVPNMESVLGLEGLSLRCLVTAGHPDETPGYMERKPVEELYRRLP